MGGGRTVSRRRYPRVTGGAGRRPVSAAALRGVALLHLLQRACAGLPAPFSESFRQRNAVNRELLTPGA